MEYIRHFLNIDLVKNNVTGAVQIQNLDIGHKLVITLSRGPTPVSLEGAGTVQFVYETPDEKKSDYEVTAEGNMIYCPITRAVTASPGEVKCEIRVYTEEAGTWITTPTFILKVNEVIYDEEKQEEITSEPTVMEQFIAEIGSWAKKDELSKVAFSGSYEDLKDTPTKVSDFENDKGYLTEHQDISGKADRSELSDVAFSGNYEDLNKKPIIPTIPENVSAFNNDAGYLTEHQDISGKADKDELAEVATSGSYKDLRDRPLIPAVPKNVSEFNNDAGYLTEHQDISGKQDKLTFDKVPTENSDNPVTSGGVYDAIAKEAPVHFIRTSLGLGNVLFGALPPETDLKDGEQIIIVTPSMEVSPNSLNLEIHFSDNLIQHTERPIYAYGSKQSNLTFPPCSILRLTYRRGVEIDSEILEGWWLDADQHQTYDAFPTPESSNPVTSDGIYRAIQEAAPEGNVDLSGYAKKEDIPTVPENISAFNNDAGYLTEHQDISGKADKTELSEYAKKENIPTVPENVSAFENDAGYLTEHQSLAGYAKQDEIPAVPKKVSAFENDKGYITEHQSLAEYATEKYVDEAVKNAAVGGDVDLSEYAKKEDIPTVPESISAFNNDAGYLTEHQSLADYATKEYVNNAVSETGGTNDDNLIIPVMLSSGNKITDVSDFDINALMTYISEAKAEKCFVYIFIGTDSTIVLPFSGVDNAAGQVTFLGEHGGIKYSVKVATVSSADEAPAGAYVKNIQYMGMPMVIAFMLDRSLSDDLYVNIDAETGLDDGGLTLTPTGVHLPEGFAEKMMIAMNNASFGKVYAIISGYLILPFVSWNNANLTANFAVSQWSGGSPETVGCEAALTPSNTGAGIFADLGNGMFLQIKLSVNY